MPAAVESSREEVKLLAQSVGVREAARRLGLSEARVLQWSKRGKWFAKPEPTAQPPTMTKNDVITVIKPSEALAAALEDHSNATKIGLSRAARKAAEKLPEMDADKLITRDVAQSARHWAGVASTVHGWDAKTGEDRRVMINIGILTQ